MRDGEPRHNGDSSVKALNMDGNGESDPLVLEDLNDVMDEDDLRIYSMGAIFLWVYVYNIVRISVEASSVDVNDSSICKYTSETTAVKPESITELGLSDISRKLNLKRLFAPSTNGAVKRYFVDELPAANPWATPVKRLSRSGENLSDEDRLYNSTRDNVFVNVVASIHYRAQSEKANDAFY
ncbi:hypothetical protein OROGR_006649 [Orobanche gracilis]